MDTKHNKETNIAITTTIHDHEVIRGCGCGHNSPDLPCLVHRFDKYVRAVRDEPDGYVSTDKEIIIKLNKDIELLTKR